MSGYAVSHELAAQERSNRRGRDDNEVSEEKALPTFRYSNNIGGRGGKQHRAPRKPLNQVERPIVFSYSHQVQAIRDILISLHSDYSPQQIQKAAAEYLALGDTAGDFETDISDVIVKAFSSLPVEIPSIATLIAIVYGSNAAFMTMLINKLSASLLDALQDGIKGVFTAKMILRSLSCLAGCGLFPMDGAGGLIAILRSLFKSIETFGVPSDARRAHTSGYLLISTLPWLANLLNDVQYTHFLHELQTCVSQLLQHWTSDFDVNGRRAIFQVNITETADGPDGCACWDNLWDGCTYAATMLTSITEGTYTRPACILTPWVAFAMPIEDSGLAFSILHKSHFPMSGDIHTLLANAIETASWGELDGSPAALKSWRNARFTIFDAELGEASAAYSRLAPELKHLIGEFVRDVIVFFAPLGLEDGTRIGSVQLAASHALAVSRLFDAADHVEYGVVETLLLLLLQPAEHDSIYIHAMLVELCKLAPSLIPPVLAAGCGVLFQLTPALDTSSWRSLGKYLQLHMVNFKLAWPYWTHWAEDCASAAYGDDDAMRGFCSFIVDGCARVIFRANVVAALPPGLQALADKDGAPSLPLFESDATDNPQVAVAQRLAQMIEDRNAPDDIEDWLDSEHEGIDDAAEGESWRGVLLVEALLFSSKRLLSTLQSLLDKYRDLVRTFLDVDGGQDALIASTAAVYGGDGGMLNFFIDNAIRRSILQPSAVVQWALAPSVVGRLTSDPWLWSHVTLAFDRALDSIRAALTLRESLYEEESDEMEAAPVEDADEEMIEGLPQQDDDDYAMDQDVRRPRSKARMQADKQAISAANEALLAVTTECRRVATLLFAGLIAAVESRRQAMVEEDELDPFLVTSLSLLRSVLRGAASAHESLLPRVNKYISGDPALRIVDRSEILAAAQQASMTPLIAASWNSFNTSF